MTMPYKSPALYEVTWHDASHSVATQHPDEMDSDYILKIVGYLSKESKTHITLSMEDIQDGRFRDTTHIPKVLIIKKRRLR